MRQSQGRLEVVDVLRGFALGGILYAHFIIWYTAGALPDSVYARFDDTASQVSMGIFGTLVLGKFFSLFSFLFGFSFLLMQRSRTGERFLPWYLCRLGILGVIGFIHHVFWRGDILLIYALLGVILLPADRLRPSLLLLFALILAFNVPTAIIEFFQRHDAGAAVLPMESEATRYVNLLYHGSLGDFLSDNLFILDSKFHFQISSGRIIITTGFFLLGLWAAKTGVLQNGMAIRTTYRISSLLLISMLAFGGLLVLTGTLTLPDLQFTPMNRWLLQFMFNSFNAALTIWYISAIAYWFGQRRVQAVLSPLRYAGRMALSGYLFQTVLGIFLFYPFGLGLFAKTSPFVNTLLVLPAFALQLYLSKLWLSRFRQGPAEWLWTQATDRLSAPRLSGRQSTVQPHSRLRPGLVEERTGN